MSRKSTLISKPKHVTIYWKQIFIDKQIVSNEIKAGHVTIYWKQIFIDKQILSNESKGYFDVKAKTCNDLLKTNFYR